MGKNHPRMRYTLPLVVNPAERKCISVYVPNEPYHIAAFRGQLEALARASSWGNDNAHTALEVARVWREVVDNTEECTVEFRQDDCHLYLVQGETETLIYNGQLCINANIADGTIKSGIANSGLGDKPGSTCYPYTFELSPLEKYFIPQRVNSGDTLSFIDYSGGTQDITGLEVFWHCPTGQAYVFGNCSEGIRGGAYPDDPSQTITHASLMVKIGDTYYDLFNFSGNPLTLVVPEGVSNALCTVMLNYGPIVGPTALGSVKGTIEWCKNSVWCYEWDFTQLSDTAGWTLEACHLVNGTGLVSNQQGQEDYMNLKRTCNSMLVAIEVWLSKNLTGTAPCVYYGLPWNIVSFSGNHALFDKLNFTPQNGDLRIGIDPDNGGFHGFWDGAITKVRLQGLGTNPFGASNC